MRFNRYKSMFLVTSQMPHPPYTSKTLLPRKFKTLPKKLGHSILCYVSFSVLSRGFWGGDGRFNPTPEGFGGCFEKALSHWQTWMQSLLAPGRPELSHFNHCPSGITYQGCQSILSNPGAACPSPACCKPPMERATPNCPCTQICRNGFLYEYKNTVTP